MAEAEWSLLFVKLLNDADLRSKFRTPMDEYSRFFESFPDDAIETYLNQGEMPAILHADQGGRVYAQSEVHFQVTLPGGYAAYLTDHKTRCFFELPPLQGHFEYDLDVKVEYCWRDGRLHLRATMAHPIYADIGQAPTPWRLLGRKRVMGNDVFLKRLKLHQEDRTEFYENIPAEELKQCLMSSVGLRAGIWMGASQCVVGMLKAAYSTQMDVNALGIDITCKRAFKICKQFYRVDQNVEVYYQWSYGSLYLAIVSEGSDPPCETGERFSEI